MPRILAVGECMAELSPPDDQGRRCLGYGGDTLNTALYMARLLGKDLVGYVTRLGDDALSKNMVDDWRLEGLDTTLVETAVGRTVGLYAIDLDDRGERSFTYWRGESPARELFIQGAYTKRLEAIERAALVYISGITLAILPNQCRQALLDALAKARAAGAMVVCDPNYRPQLWPDMAAAQHWMGEVYRTSSIVVTSPDEEQRLFGNQEIATRTAAEIVVKQGGAPCLLLLQGKTFEVTPPAVLKPRDTTGAGDAFNAAYLATRFSGGDPMEAARAGHRLAAKVIMSPGAILPSNVMIESAP